MTSRTGVLALLRHFRHPTRANWDALPLQARDYSSWTSSSLALAGIQPGRNRPARVNLVVPPLSASGGYAGVRTAWTAGLRLAAETGLSLRVMALPSGKTDHVSQVRAWRKLAGDPELEVVELANGSVLQTTEHDLWVVTFWTTAHAADVAARLGLLDPARVVYLVQDCEVGFHQWSTNAAAVQATYRAGFQVVVNSTPLARYLADREGVIVDPGRVFAPDLDWERLADVSASRRSDRTLRVFFYSRPSKPRNLYALGTSTLMRLAATLPSSFGPVEIVTAGEAPRELSLGSRVSVTQRGKTSWDGYFELLRHVDVGLSLMLSPHPSHPPLELAASGARAVTNRFYNYRDGLHPRLRTTEADPDLLASALIDGLREAREQGPGSFIQIPDGHLGEPLGNVIESVAAST